MDRGPLIGHNGYCVSHKTTDVREQELLIRSAGTAAPGVVIGKSACVNWPEGTVLGGRAVPNMDSLTKR